MRPGNSTDVVIIGGGAAGLAAWRELHSAGIGAVILEARDRLGGRIMTHYFPQAPVELGAEFVHGKPKATWAVIEKAHLEVAESADTRVVLEQGVLRPCPEYWKIIERIHRQIDPAQEICYDRFLATANGSPFEKLVARSFVEGFEAARTDWISAPAIAIADRAAAETEGESQFRLRAGYGSLVDWLAADVPRDSLHLQTVVREIRWRSGHVDVTTDTESGRGNFSAARLVVTVPLGVLQASLTALGAIRFDPPLPQKEAALQHLEMGHVVKLPICFKDRFWNNRGPFGFAISFAEQFPTWWSQDPQISNVLTGWSGGPVAQRLSKLSAAELLDRAIGSLSRIFAKSPGWLGECIDAVHYHNWSNDPFARGAYSYPKVGGLEAARALADPVGDTIFFAGEATDFQGASGTVHAALKSGTTTARKITRAFFKQNAG